MASWVDLVNSARQSTDSGLDRLFKNKNAKADRRQQGLQRWADMLFSSNEADKQRDYSTDERESSQEYATGERVSGQEYATGERVDSQEYQSTEEQLARSWQQKQNQIDRKWTLLRDESQNEAAMDRLNIQIDANIDDLERRNEIEREEYGVDKNWTDPVTGRPYSWSTNQDFELIKLQMQSDRLAYELRMRSDLADNPDMGEQIREAYEFAKSEILWDPQAQTFRNLEEIPEDELRQLFDSAIVTGGFSGIDQAAMDQAYSLFTAFIDRAPEIDPPPDAGTGGGVLGIPITTDIGKAFTEDGDGYLSRSAAPFMELFGRIFPDAADRSMGITESPEVPEQGRIPEGNVTTRERDIFRQLVELGANNPEAWDYIDEITQPGEASNLIEIMDFINNAIPQQPREFNIRRPD